MQCGRIGCTKEARYQCAGFGCTAVYCSQTCQRVAWSEDGHREVCGRVETIESFLGKWFSRKESDKDFDAKHAPPPGEVSDEQRAALERAAKRTQETSKTNIMTHLKPLAKIVKEHKGDIVAPAKDASKEALMSLLKSVARTGFKVTLAGAKTVAGAAAEVADVTAIPFDEIVDAISTAINALIFAGTALKQFYDTVKAFMSVGEIVPKLRALMRFDGGLPGCATAVDELFELFDKLGLKKRAQDFMGMIIGSFERFIRWAAPLIGSVVGLAIPYDATISGTVVEFFLYVVRFVLDEAWLLLLGLWEALPKSIRGFITNRDQWTSMLIGVANMLKKLFPPEDDSWKGRAAAKLASAGLTVLRYHPLVIVSAKARAKVEELRETDPEKAKHLATTIDRKVNAWIDDKLIPNMDKLPTIIHGALGLGFSMVYMLYAYTPEGTKKRFRVTAVVHPSAAAIACALCSSDEYARAEFTRDTEQRMHEIRAIMCEVPSAETVSYLAAVRAAGVPFDPAHPALAMPAVCEVNFARHLAIMGAM